MGMLRRLPVELLFWVTALLLLGTADLHDHGTAGHFTLCPLANMGFTWCPGCGIGRSIAHLLQGNIAASLEQHWFGMPALLILGYRLVELSKISLKNHKAINYKI